MAPIYVATAYHFCRTALCVNQFEKQIIKRERDVASRSAFAFLGL